MALERVGPYRLERRLGAGGMGEVFEAYDERLDRRVALKLIRPSRARDDAARERLRREARANARLNHPNIVQVFDILQTDEADCIVMELVNGRSLAERLRRGPLEVTEALAVALEVVGALAEAHELGIVHRDLKPENVLITTAGRAKVLDFGIAKSIGSAAPGLTGTGVILGTCRAMSPEQAEGGEIDARSDLFSFGSLLYEMVTGRSPFATGNEIATLFRVRHYHHTPAHEANPQVPEVLSALIDRLLEKDRERRPRSAREVGEAIEKIQLRWTGRPSGRLSAPAAVSRGAAADTEVTLMYSHPASSSTGERRQVTLMHCGLVLAGGGSPDPEDLLASMAWLQGAAAEVAQRYEGTLGQVTPDGVQILFGYPLAHEDDARRAVHAALLLRGRAAGGQLDGLALRVGIHTGPMVVAWTEPSMQEGLTLGETASLAAAVQSLAEPGAILLSGATHRLAGPFFTCETLAPVHLPSLQRPVETYRVVADRDVEDRIDSGTGEALTPLVARDRELALLLERWSLAREGKGQVAMVAGEAGIGKSRLVHELRQRIAAEGPAQLDCRCSPYYSNTALHPVTEMLRRLLHSSPQTQPAEQLGRLEEMIGRYDLPPAETVPLFAALLGLPAEEGYAPLNLSPERQRVKTLDALVALLVAVAERQPLLLVVEDLHWVDPTTLELLSLLFQQVPAMRILGLLTYRPDFVAPWPSRSYLAQLHLEPLTPEQVQRMAEHLTEGHPLPAPLLEQMAAKTDGVPLVVEEMVKMVLESFQDESEPDPLRALEIPATLRDSLTARLDRLGMAKEVAQLASVLGREFPYELLSAVSPWDGTVLQQHLNRLVEAELLYRRGMPPRTSYLFKHALIQEAAYASMLKSARQRQHRRTAEVLEERFPKITQRHPELLAHHYSEAGLKEQALAAWKRAGEEAILSSANREAVGHFHRALDLLAAMPETAERHREEIAVQVGLGVALFSVESPASPQVERAFVRARELCARVESAPQLPTVLRGQYAFELCSGQHERAHDTAVELLELARRLGDPMLLLIGYQGLGFALMMQGELAAARAQLEQGIAGLDAERSGAALLTPGGGHPAVECIACLAWALWFLGFPDAALQRSDEALALARGHPRAHSFALLMAGRVHVFRGEIDKVRERVQEFDAVTVEYGLPGVRPSGMVMQGWVLVEQGQEEEGIAELTRNLGILRQVGMLHWMPQNLAWLAEAHARAGRLPEALALLDDALAVADSGDQRLAEAELHRLRAELRAQQGALDGEVEAELHRALEIARRQQSKSFELRAAASLARFLAARGRRSEGRDLLAGVYGWFTEGFETGDLRAARALLDELS